MAISIQDGFSISSAVPVDSRFVVDTLAQRDAMVPEVRYTGLTCFVREDQTRHILKAGILNTDWEPDNGGGSGGAGSAGTISFLSSKNTKTTDWYATLGTVNVTENKTLVNEKEITWYTDGSGPATKYLYSKPIPVGDFFKNASTAEPITLELSQFLRVSAIASGSIGIAIVGYNSSDSAVLTASKAVSAFSAFNKGFALPFLIEANSDVAYFRIRYGMLSISEECTLIVDNVALSVSIPEVPVIRTITASGTHVINPWDSIVMIKPSVGETGAYNINLPATGQFVTIKYVPNTNEKASVIIVNAEAENNSMYSNMSRKYFYDKEDNIWRAI